MATPLEIKIALHYFVSPEPYAEDGWRHRSAPAVMEAHVRFVEKGLLKRLDEPNKYGCLHEPTDGLVVYVEAICRIPFPKIKTVWTIED